MVTGGKCIEVDMISDVTVTEEFDTFDVYVYHIDVMDEFIHEKAKRKP